MATMPHRNVIIRAAVLGGLLALLPATPALAYIGPGAGLTAIGTVLAVVAAVFLAIAGFVWYPIKRMLGLGKKPAGEGAEAGETGAAATAED